ncbi:MAG: PDZ domain-containing protein [Burkholderiaceae bacterium]|nr:PDZ domain-containing protein [Burkholderiaceae bacterium]MCD8515751.1 PDZ domain-containing protein [Burkholderiaceae bacterium]MCD8537255.1 PDZ domain-containing protein [Burkholderiaceae bacterium]MCD8564915.1 PDZ domain-containing protein [Burkholderiaceae bacterium]
MKQQTLRYTVEPHDLAGHRLRVTLQIEQVAGSSQTVSMPAWIPGSYLIRDFSRHIETIRGRHGGRWHTPKKLDDHRWVFDRCSGSLSIEIVVYAWDLSVRGAHVDDTHAFFNGTSVFLKPHGLENTPCQVDIKRPAGKRGWRAYTSMPASISNLPADSLGRFMAPDYDALIDHPFELGTPQVVRFEACGAKHSMVFTGKIPNLDLARIARDVKKICEAQIRLFDPEKARAPFLDSAPEYVFMTMVTADGYGGLEHRASTALVTSRHDLPTKHQANPPEGYVTFLGLVSHEYFHTWHVKRIKPAAFVPYDLSRPNHTRLLWIFEGFTSYYDDLMLVRSGVIDQPTYLKQLSKTITSVHAGPGRYKQSLANSSFDAWTKYYKQDENAPNSISSYYAKGSLVALGLDLVIRQRTQNRFCLDDVMRMLWREFGERFYQGQPQGLTETGFARIVQQATGVDVRPELEQWVEQTGDVPLQALLHTQGFELRWINKDDLPSLDATFKPQGESLAVRQVIEGGSAHQAGLSAGDVLVACNDLRIGNSVNSLKQLLGAYRPGDKVTLHAFRGDVLQARGAKLSKAPASTCDIKPAKQKAH